MKQRSARQTSAARIAVLLATTALTNSLHSGPALAQNLPTGGSVAAGGVVIAAPTPTQLTITQTTPSGVVNWQSFSVGQGYAVNIQQPDSTSAMLNRVTGNTPSTIAGSITANGQVYLVNPNGIAITSTGVVNTGGFVASTLGISDSDFMAGKRTFTGSGASAGVSNAGTITTGRGGYAALIGGTVENTGNILVPLGKVALGSGERATLDFSGDGFLQVAVPTKSGGSDALIRNSGNIRADGGSVIISAATARDAARNAVNVSGVVQARTIGGRTGSIVIGGGLGGAVKISGTVAATGRKTTGGAITVTGQHIVLDGAIIDVTGRTGGGTIHIGGERQGQGSLQHADTLTVDAATTIRADATTAGNGGDVVLWSDQLTMFAGTITARGGFETGNGGEVEVSGKAKLGYTGFTDLSATHGAFGTLLLDPYNVTIYNGTNNTGGSFDANIDDSLINASTLQIALGAANVTVSSGSGGTQAGNITVAAPLTWAAATTLTLNAAGAIAINAPISITGAGGLALTATAQAGITTTGLTFGNGASVTYGATDNGGTFSLNGLAYTLVYSMAQLDAIDGKSAVDNSLIASYGTGLEGNFALANDLVASGTTYTSAVIADADSANIAGSPYVFGGKLDGLGHTITGLTIDAPAATFVGLIGYLGGVDVSVSNIGLVGGSVSGRQFVGALVGFNNGPVVQNSYASTAVTGTSSGTGGLIGRNHGLVQASYATGTVNGSNRTGGLVGYNALSGVVQNSYATGTVIGINNTGGLVGQNSNNSTVRASYATGAVSGTDSIGGLVGAVFGTARIESSYATGSVSGNTRNGGLIGLRDESATVSTSYWNTQTSGLASGIGMNINDQSVDITGLTTAELQGALPVGLDAAIWSTASGRNPYLNWEVAAPVPVSPPPPAPVPQDAQTPVPNDTNPGFNATVGPQTSRTTMSFQSDQSGTGSITPLTATPVRVATDTTQPAPTTQPQQTAAAQNADDEIVTGSVGPQAIKSADGFIYRPISQHDATQYSDGKLPGYEGEAGDATVVAMLLRGTQRSNDTPKIDQLFEPGKGLQWKGVNWENPVADKVSFSDGVGHVSAAGESFPIQSGTTDLAALLSKGVVILTASGKEPSSASFPLLGIAMTAQGVVANDPGTGRQVLLSYNAEAKSLGAISSVLDSKTGIWTKLADMKPDDGVLSQPQLDRLAKLSVDRFAAVGITAGSAR